MENLTIYDIAVAPLIIAIVAFATEMGLPKKYAPSLSLALGVAAGVIYVAPNDPKQGVVIGLALGIAAVGLHSGTKNSVKKD